jgi:hypothetical protein
MVYPSTVAIFGAAETSPPCNAEERRFFRFQIKDEIKAARIEATQAYMQIR